MSRWGDRATDIGFATAWRTVRTLPYPVAWATFRAAADRAARRRGPSVQRLERNLARVMGRAPTAAERRDALRSYARYWLQAFRLPSMSRQQVMAGFQLEGSEKLGAAVAAGTGCVAALSHSGNWDLAGAWACGNGWPLTTVAERLRPESLFRRFVAFRESLGMEIIATTGGSRPPMDALVDAVSRSALVPLLADRDLSSRGIEVSFFGGRTRMPGGPALLALRTGAPLFVVPLWYDGDVVRGRVDGPVPVPTAGALDERVRVMTQAVADGLAAGIVDHPTDWHMLQPLWLDDLPARRTLATGRRSPSPDGPPAAPVGEAG